MTTTTRKTNTSTKITVKTQSYLEGNEADDFSQQSRREKLIHRRIEPEDQCCTNRCHIQKKLSSLSSHSSCALCTGRLVCAGRRVRTLQWRAQGGRNVQEERTLRQMDLNFALFSERMSS